MIRDPLGQQGGHLEEVRGIGEVVIGAGEDHEDVLAGEFLGEAPALVERSKSVIYFSGCLPGGNRAVVQRITVRPRRRKSSSKVRQGMWSRRVVVYRATPPGPYKCFLTWVETFVFRPRGFVIFFINSRSFLAAAPGGGSGRAARSPATTFFFI